MLNGQTALVVEGEFLIALDIQRMLETLGVEQTLFARTPAEAEQLRAQWTGLSVAIVELRSDDAATRRFATELDAAGVAVVLVSVDLDAQHGIAELPGMPVVLKPISEEAMTSAIEQALATSR